MTQSPGLTVYGALWCPDCRRSKQFLAEHRIPYRWVDIEQEPEAQDTVRQLNDGRQIIPTIVFDDGGPILVEPSDAELAARLGINPQASRSHYDLIIVGGGPAGLTAAIYAAREGMDTLVIERGAVGGQAGSTERIDNYPGFAEGISGAELADRMRQQAERFGVELLVAQTVASINPGPDSGGVRTVTTETGQEYRAPALLLTPGTRYRRLNVPGEEDFIGAGVHFCATCDGPFYRDMETLVVGGGNSGVEEGLFLTRFASHVTVLEVGDRLRASQVLQDKAAAHPRWTSASTPPSGSFAAMASSHPCSSKTSPLVGRKNSTRPAYSSSSAWIPTPASCPTRWSWTRAASSSPAPARAPHRWKPIATVFSPPATPGPAAPSRSRPPWAREPLPSSPSAPTWKTKSAIAGYRGDN